MMERLRVDHECEHTRWRYRDGGGICQHCGHHLPKYLFVSVGLNAGVVEFMSSFSVVRVVRRWRVIGADATVCEKP